MFEDRPKLAAWRDRVKKALGEKLFDEAHEGIMKASCVAQQLLANPNLEMIKPVLQKFFR